MAMKVTQQTSQILGSGSRMQFIAIVVLELLLVEGIYGWTYHDHEEEMPWNNARKFCKEKYTDMVAIQNAEEIKYLNDRFPFAQSYYWIGIRKVNDTWIWVGTAMPLNKEAENWAKGEPNNVGKTEDEDCVEMYIKRELDPGRWNDIACCKKKRPLCYTASCSPKSCSNNGECIETIGNYSCLCNDGFYGPECEHAVQCATLEDQEQMTMTCSKPRAPFSYNTTCKFSCADGFELRGSEQLECGATGQWSAAAPHCEAVQCATLEDQEQMTMTCSNPRAPFSYNTTCEFSCADGFELRGSEQLECGATGQWSAAAPHCEAVQCATLEDQEQMTMTCSNPRAPFSYNTTCEFSCADGFELRGSEQLECGATGQWSAAAPHCEAVQCATLEDQEQMTMTCSNPRAPFSYNATCEFSCADGFELRGSEQLECGATGQWSAAAPHCEAVQCATLEDQEQMTMTCSKPRAPFSYNTTCEFSCADGFELRGSEQLECGATGQWSAAAPHCEAVQCENLEKQDQVVMTCSEKFRYSSTCSFSCQDGFTLSGASRIDCAATGQWTAPVPTCQAVQCATLEDQEQMTMTCSKPRAPFSYNTTCEFSCADGFELRGSEQLECGATGQWSAAAPHCEAVKCGVLQIPENGKIHCSHPMDNLCHRSVCKFDCLEEYLLNGSVSVECDGSGQWSSPIPTCEDSNPQPIHENSTPIIISSAVASGVSGLMMIAWIARQLRKKAQGKTFSLLSKEAQKTSGTYKLNEEV